MQTCIYHLKKVWKTESLTFTRQANKQYLNSYDPKQESRHIIYLEANNLDGYARNKFLPPLINHKGFD